MIDRGCPNKNDSIVSAMLFLFYKSALQKCVVRQALKCYIYAFFTAKADKFAI